jgi:hypothetical protein
LNGSSVQVGQAQNMAISNMQQPYISLFVSSDPQEHQYTFRMISCSRSLNHTARTD